MLPVPFQPFSLPHLLGLVMIGHFMWFIVLRYFSTLFKMQHFALEINAVVYFSVCSFFKTLVGNWQGTSWPAFSENSCLLDLCRMRHGLHIQPRTDIPFFIRNSEISFIYMGISLNSKKHWSSASIRIYCGQQKGSPKEAIKMVNVLEGKPYEEYLRSFGLFSLEETEGGPHCCLELPYKGKQRGRHWPLLSGDQWHDAVSGEVGY